MGIRQRVRDYIASLLQNDLRGDGNLTKEVWEECATHGDVRAVHFEILKIITHLKTNAYTKSVLAIHYNDDNTTEYWVVTPEIITAFDELLKEDHEKAWKWWANIKLGFKDPLRADAHLDVDYPERGIEQSEKP